jgi:hypothetical protein
VAPWWSRSAAEGDCREASAREESEGDNRSGKGEDRSPSSQASAWSGGLEEEGGLMAKAEEAWTQLATRIPKELHRRLKLHCVTHEITVMHFVVEAVEEKLRRKRGSKRGTA